MARSISRNARRWADPNAGLSGRMTAYRRCDRVKAAPQPSALTCRPCAPLTRSQRQPSQTAPHAMVAVNAPNPASISIRRVEEAVMDATVAPGSI